MVAETLPLPRAWIGREKVIWLLLSARLSTAPNDWHQEALRGLLLSCWSLRTFPALEAYEKAIRELETTIKGQVFEGSLIANDPDGRLRWIQRLLRASANEMRIALAYRMS